uniref:arginine kinase n=1 Tax=Ditylenchus dipsaci TaxID=166011 RepID=A0A915DMK6_9BILA
MLSCVQLDWLIVVAVVLSDCAFDKFNMSSFMRKGYFYLYSSTGGTNEAQIKKIEESFKQLQATKDCHSLLKKHLTESVMNQLKHKRPSWEPLSMMLFVVVSPTPIQALEYMLQMLKYHGFGPKEHTPAVDLGKNRLSELPPLDPERKYIKSTRIRCGRTLSGYPFNPLLTQDDYIAMQAKVKKSLEDVSDKSIAGKYYPLEGMTKPVQSQLIADHFLFKEGDRFLKEANACNYWPKGRGIFHNNEKTFLVWVNEEDHLRLISMQNDGNVGQVLERLIKGIEAIESKVPNFRPRFRAYQPAKISAKKEFKEICEKLKLQVRGIHGEHSESEGGIYDISNKARLGLTEFEAVKQMYDGVKHLIELEKKA